MRDKLFFFDIDNTLARRGVMPEGNRDSLMKLRALGYEVFICSGRPPFYVKDLFSDVTDGCVCCNGRYIFYHGEPLFSNPLTEDERNYYLSELDRLDCGILLIDETSYCCVNIPEDYEERIQKDYSPERQILNPEGIDCLTFDICYRDAEHLSQIEDTFADTLIINDHPGIFSADCSTRNFDKGSAVAWLTSHFGLDKENIYAFGDGYNDQAMFREAGHRIAMGNAVDILKEKATYVTDDFDDNGIYNALVHEEIL